MKRLSLYIFALVAFAFTLSSCGDRDYRNSLPSGCTMLASINFTDKDAASDLGFLTSLLKMDDPAKCGIDVTKKVYAFETADGNFGLCAKVSSQLDLETYVGKLSKLGMLKLTSERDNSKFATIADKFVAGWDKETLLIMGPVLASQQKNMIQQISNLLEQDEDESMQGSALMEKLDAQTGAVVVAAQVTALPEQVASVFTIGAPKDVEPSQIAFAASMDIRDDMLVIDSEPFSENNAVDQYLKQSYGTFRQIGDSYLKSLDAHSLFGLYLNVDGKKFLPLLQQTPSFKALLAGINSAIDLDAVIKSINGDVLITVPEYSPNNLSLTMAAKLGQSNFLNDVSYWKKSVPAGATLVDWKENAYAYHSDDYNFFFGVQNYTPLQFYAGTTQALAEQAIAESQKPVDDAVIKTISSKRLALVMNLSALLPADGGMATLMLPSIMKVKHIVYMVK